MSDMPILDRSPAPMSLNEVLDPAWLSRALSRPNAEVCVKSAQLLEKIGTSAIAARIRLEFSASPPPGIPAQICIKGLFGVRHQVYLDNGPLMAESNFYRHCAEAAGVHVPRCFYAGVDDKTRAGVVILEDLVPRNARVFSGLDAFTLDQVHQTLELYARVHGWSWNAPADQYPWVDNKLILFTRLDHLPALKLTDLLRGERGIHLPDWLRDGEKLYTAMRKLHERAPELHSNFIHGDCHAGNAYEVGGRMGLFDWQIFQRGSWSIDVASHLGAVLTVEDRRKSEMDLLFAIISTGLLPTAESLPVGRMHGAFIASQLPMASSCGR